MLRLLTDSQACALYRAMAELNNIGARLHAYVPLSDKLHKFDVLHVVEYEDNTIHVFVGTVSGFRTDGAYGTPERYDSQAHFANCYGIV